MKELYEALYPLVQSPKLKESLIEGYAKVLFDERYRGSGVWRPWSSHKDKWIAAARSILEEEESHALPTL